MARNGNLVVAVLLFVLSLVSLVRAAPGNWRENESVCQSPQYRDLLYLAEYSPAQDYCHSHYPYVPPCPRRVRRETTLAQTPIMLTET